VERRRIRPPAALQGVLRCFRWNNAASPAGRWKIAVPRRFQWVKAGQGASVSPLFDNGNPLYSLAPFPLTLYPSPLGRGKHRWRRMVKPQLLPTSSTGERVSLSPREREGVRGNRAIENPRPDVIHRNSLPVIPPKTSKNQNSPPFQGWDADARRPKVPEGRKQIFGGAAAVVGGERARISFAPGGAWGLRRGVVPSDESLGDYLPPLAGLSTTRPPKPGEPLAKETLGIPLKTARSLYKAP